MTPHIARGWRACSTRTVREEGQRVLGWRDVPVAPEHTGEVAGACRPAIRQLFVGAGSELARPAAGEGAALTGSGLRMSGSQMSGL